jgi:hypothetical protein
MGFPLDLMDVMGLVFDGDFTGFISWDFMVIGRGLSDKHWDMGNSFR